MRLAFFHLLPSSKLFRNYEYSTLLPRHIICRPLIPPASSPIKAKMSSNDGQQFTAALQSNLSSADPASIPSAVTAFTKPIATSWQSGASSSDIEGQLWEAWGAAIKFAASTADDQQDGITQVFKEARQLGAIKNQDEQACKVQGGIVWTDLPVFGASLREAWNPDPSDVAGWRNKNAFAARLTNVEYKESPLDFGLYGIWSNRSALESQAAAKADWSSLQPVDIEASCMWFVYAAQTLIRFCNDNKSFDGKIAKAGDGYQDKNWNGFSVERWALWKENLQALQDSGAQSSSSDLIKAALDAIAYAEQNSV